MILPAANGGSDTRSGWGRNGRNHGTALAALRHEARTPSGGYGAFDFFWFVKLFDEFLSVRD